MAVKIRLKRIGAKKKPFYRIVVADARYPRDGRFIEQIGTYDPMTDPAKVTIDGGKALQWMKNGAQPTDTVRALLKSSGALERARSEAVGQPAAAGVELADGMPAGETQAGEMQAGEVQAGEMQAGEAPVEVSSMGEPIVDEAPAEGTPEIIAPVVEAPVVEAPVVEAPAVEAPVVDAPVPVVEAPAVEALAVEEPAEEPAVEATALADAAVMEEPAGDMAPEA